MNVACLSLCKEWNDPRLESARREVWAEIEGGINRFLILNIDQVWRQALRFSKKLIMKGKQRTFEPLSSFTFSCFLFSKISNVILQLCCDEIGVLCVFLLGTVRNMQGAKQQGHIIARSDNWSATRQSITAITSTWADGTRGPLGLCYPTGAFRPEQVEHFNKTFKGECYMFDSESKSHFMCGNTFQTLMHGLLTPAYARKRKELGLDWKDQGMLLADAWTGFP